MRVLVAEDDPAMLNLVSTLVEGWGYEVLTAEDGADAARLLQEEDAPRLAVLDWKMPSLSGLEVVEVLRRQRQKEYTYVLLLTAESEKDRLLEALRAGCDDYITKPFDSRELEARLFVGRRIIQLQQKLADALQLAQYEGSHDSLTGAFNRGYVFQHLQRELARAARHQSPLALILLDVDHFKGINDSFGHMTGDEVLRQLVSGLIRCTRQYDVVGRYGGEEFVVILPNCGQDEAIEIAERIRVGVSATPLKMEKQELSVTVSAGVAVANVNSDASTLLQDADSALYRAKLGGRNQVHAAPKDCALPYSPKVGSASPDVLDDWNREGIQI